VDTRVVAHFEFLDEVIRDFPDETDARKSPRPASAPSSGSGPRTRFQPYRTDGYQRHKIEGGTTANDRVVADGSPPHLGEGCPSSRDDSDERRRSRSSGDRPEVAIDVVRVSPVS